MIAVHNSNFIGLFMGGLVLLGSITSDASSELYGPVAVHQGISITSSVKQETVIQDKEQLSVVHALVRNEKQDIKIHDEEQDTEIRGQEQDRAFHLLEVNKITLQDDQDIVVEKLGKPQAIIIDPYISEMETYEYKDMNIGFINGMVDYVQVFPTGGTVQIDDTLLQITIQDITNALGEPDFEAEDGLVFQRNEYLLKIFIDEITGEVVSVDYYHMSAV